MNATACLRLRPPAATRTSALVRARARAHAGMTLIEVMLVLLIIGLMISSVAFGVGGLPHARLRTSATRLASTFRFAYVHALTTGRTTRVSFRMGSRDFVVEDTDDAHVLEHPDPRRTGGGSAAAVEQQAISDAQLQTNLQPRAPRATFTRLPDRVFHARPLEQGIAFATVYTQHETDPRTSGTGSVYFFSGGQSERALVQLLNSRGEIYSVSLNPLTGRAEILDRPAEPAVVEDRDTTDEVETDERARAVQPEGSR